MKLINKGIIAFYSIFILLIFLQGYKEEVISTRYSIYGLGSFLFLVLILIIYKSLQRGK